MLSIWDDQPNFVIVVPDYGLSLLHPVPKPMVLSLLTSKTLGFHFPQSGPPGNILKDQIRSIIILLVLLPFFSPAQTNPKTDSLMIVLNSAIDDVNRALLQENIGYEYMLIGNRLESIAQYNAAYDYYSKQGDKLAQARVLEALGEMYRNEDSANMAIEYFLKALTLYEEAGRTQNIISIYNSMMDLFMRQADFRSANQYLLMAKGLLQTNPDAAGQAQWFTNKGRYLNYQKNFDSAIYYHKKAVTLFDSLRLFNGKGRAMHNIANSLREKGEYAPAIKICLEVLAIKEINENIKSKIFTLLLLADLYNSTAQYNKAITLSLESLRLSELHSFLDRKRVSLLYLSQIYENVPDFRKAYFYHKRYAELMDTIFDQSKYEQVTKMKTIYETEKKEKTIEVQQATLKASEATIALQETKTNQLIFIVVFAVVVVTLVTVGYIYQNRSNRILLQQKEEIEKKNHEREILLKEIHHRVKNNLQVISSLLNMQSRTMTDTDAKKAVREGQSRIKSMALIHQKLYSEDNLSKINIKGYLNELGEFLYNTYKPGNAIDHSIQSEDYLMDIEIAVPLGLIVNELLSNSFKYAFEKGQQGSVYLSLAKEENEYTLEVSDSGKGLPEGFDTKKSMGINLVKILVEQLNGILVFKNTPGAMFTIKFKDIAIT